MTFREPLIIALAVFGALCCVVAFMNLTYAPLLPASLAAAGMRALLTEESKR
jgi:hypothetical protein